VKAGVASHDRFVDKKPARETRDAVVRPAIMRLVERRIVSKGIIELPCIPGLLDDYVKRLTTLWESLGKPFSKEEKDQLRELLARGLETGYTASPHATIIIRYETQPPPSPGINYTGHVKVLTMTEVFEKWLSERKPPFFGSLPDAKLVELAAQLGEPSSIPFLDVGAGTGRNAIALARRGHPTTAIEVTAGFADEMRKAAEAAGVKLEVITADIGSSELKLAPAHYKLVVMAEVLTHFRHANDVRGVFSKFADAVAPGGLVLVSVFLPTAGYKLDEMTREAAQTAWSCAFNRGELEFITKELPFDRLSDESVHDYEHDHLPEEDWPPTGWFIDWSQGRNIADLPGDRTPIELRWLVYRRR
jgi:SAM-dependent methyltransferase